MSRVPYNMFNQQQTEREVVAARKLLKVYYVGQDKIWNGKDELEEAQCRHGGIDLSPEKASALKNIFAVIFWGELAAWKTSAEFAYKIEPLAPKMAATAQAHDEARHFVAMYDYLQLVGYTPKRLPPAAAKVISCILGANHISKKLLGMQLMVEPVAITIFHMVRKSNVEPVLCDMLHLFEKDEARHIALGVNYLPTIMRKMSWRGIIELWIWQLRLLLLELDGLKELEEDFKVLGIDPLEVFHMAEKKQIAAMEELLKELQVDLPVVTALRRIVNFKKEINFPSGTSGTIPGSGLMRAARMSFLQPLD